MKFTKTAEEAENDTRGSGGSGNFMKYLKDGDQTIRILEETDQWRYYWEHFNPNGFPFPCNEQDDCPGCTSDLEKMVKVQRRVAVNCWDGQYHNVWKLPKTVADKLKARAERLGTITDRDYTITRLKTGNGENARWDYDIEGGSKEPTDAVYDGMIDPYELLTQAWEDAWGTSAKAQPAAQTSARGAAVQRQLAAGTEEAEPEITEMELRSMKIADLKAFIAKNDLGELPASRKSVDRIVDWILDQVE